mgnify:CR=1 FL=1
MSTRLMCYVSDTMEKTFICREALISLGIIHANFPNVTTVIPPNIAASIENSEDVTCSCPRRQPTPPPSQPTPPPSQPTPPPSQPTPPPIPTILPPGLNATEEHVGSP